MNAYCIQVNYFASFNLHGPSLIEYSQFEYDECLVDPDWTPHESKYLFDLLKQYDLRFVIAADRYEYSGLNGEGSPKRRSVEVRNMNLTVPKPSL